MAFKFSKLNRTKKFTVDTTDFGYTDLEELHSQCGGDEEYVFPLMAVFIGEKSKYGKQPIIATDTTWVNMPRHQLEMFEAIADDEEAVKAINEGEAGFTIRKYYSKRHSKWCYEAVLCDVE